LGHGFHGLETIYAVGIGMNCTRSLLYIETIL